MPVPILKQGPYLIVTVQTDLPDKELLELRDALIDDVGRHRSRAVILDVTSIDVMDSFSTRTLLEIAHMIRLRGAETVIVGIQPEVAFAMVRLGLVLEGVTTALDLEEGLSFLEKKARRTMGKTQPRGK